LRNIDLKERRRSLLAVLITFAVSSLSATIVFPILAPLFLSKSEAIIRGDIPENIRAILLGLFLASFPLAQFIFSPLVGEYADRKGRKKAYLITLGLEVIGYFFSAIAISWHHLSVLFVGRFITGLAAGNMSVCLATLVDLSPDEKTKVRYFSYGSAVIGVMFVLGPFIGGKLSDPSISPWFNLAFPMWIGVLLSLLNFIILWSLFKETLDKEVKEPFDPIKALHNVQLAFRTKEVKDLYIIYFFFLFAWNMLYQFMPAILVQEFGFNSSRIGDVFAFMGAVWIVGTILMNFIVHSGVNSKYVLIFSLAIFALVTLFVLTPKTMTFFLLFVAIGVFFAGGVWPIFTGAISNAAEQSIQGKVLGLSSAIQSLSMMLAPLLGGFFLQVHSQIPFMISAAATLIAILLLFRTKRTHFKM
jgi:DHA1 family tetracycline resistance protein-like MFS transporter